MKGIRLQTVPVHYATINSNFYKVLEEQEDMEEFITTSNTESVQRKKSKSPVNAFDAENMQI